jgi:hypothetical protein
MPRCSRREILGKRERFERMRREEELEELQRELHAEHGKVHRSDEESITSPESDEDGPAQ